jgi:hypothetical protein
MLRVWGVVVLTCCVAVAGEPAQNRALGQILAMPPSMAEDTAPPPYDASQIEPAQLDASPGAAGILLPGTRYSTAPGGILAPQLGPRVGQVGNLPPLSGPWTWELLPAGLIFEPYLADAREPRIGGQFVHEQGAGWLLDASLGGRVGFLRYGTSDPLRPEGWQLDFEGAAFPRIALDGTASVLATDYRYGVPLSFRHGVLEAKLGYYHLSSHLADEFIATHAGAVGNQYSRDALVWGLGLWPTDYLRLYAEAGWGFRTKGPGEPWEFQFGAELSPTWPTGWRGAPFLALNGHIRQEVDFGGSLTVQAGWQWRGRGGQLLRTGVHYFNGKSDQMQWLNQFEQQIGMGIWYDF